MIGATTLDEYRKHIEKDAALEPRFQTVLVDEPDVEDTVSILRGLRERLEVFHGVKIQDAALVAAATLSHRYITDRFLPDKGDRPGGRGVCAAAHEIDSMPAELDEITRRVTQLEIEEAAGQRDRRGQQVPAGGTSRIGRSAIRGRRPARSSGMPNGSDPAVQELRGQLEQLRHEAEEAERNYDLNQAAELRYGQITELERKLQAAEEQLVQQGEKPLLREVVTEDEIAEIVAAWTGIPVARLQEGEREKLLRLDEILHERVIGQDEAVQLVADAVIRARSGIRDPRRPIGSFIFLGPTGVGKTELAKTLAAALFDSEDNTSG